MSENHTGCENVRTELKDWIDKSETRLVCTFLLNNEIKLINGILSRLRFLGIRFSPLDDRWLPANLLATIVLVCFLYALTIVSTAFANRLVQIWNPAVLFVSFLSAIALSVVKYLHDSILTRDQSSFAKQIIPTEIEVDNGIELLLRWWKSFLNLWWEIPFVLASGLLGFASLWYFSAQSPIEIHAGSYLLIFLCGIALGQGGYCAVRIPTLASVLSALSLPMFWLYPADTLWIRKASSIFTKLSLANAFFGTCIMIGLLCLRPWKSSTTAFIAAVWLLFTWTVVLYSFVYPHYQLGKALKAEKRCQTDKLQALIVSLRTLMESCLDETAIKRLNETIKVYDQLAAARASAIDMQAILRLLLSLGIPTISFIAVLIDFGRRLNEFLTNSGFRR